MSPFLHKSLSLCAYNGLETEPINFLLFLGKPENFRYFINFERCKNRGVSYGNEYVDDTPTVAGPEILSSDVHCTPESVKYLNDGRWVKLMTPRRGIKIPSCYATLH